jgi:MoxR-like ATPase
MKILVRYPSRAELVTIVERSIERDEISLESKLDRTGIMAIRRLARQVLVAPHIQDFAVDLVMATQPDQGHAHPLAKKYIRYGSSPRGAQALVECGRVVALMHGRNHLSGEDLHQVAPGVLRHRVILNFDAHADGQTPETVLGDILKGVSSQTTAAR